MNLLATTRFNNDTLQQNRLWKEKNNHHGSIYGTPLRMSERYLMDDSVFIIEMNNDENQVAGVGLIKNYIYEDKKYRIYKDGNYNRYIYKSNFHISRDEMTDEQINDMKLIEEELFYGKGHLKRGHGITSFPEKKKKKECYEICKKAFLQKYPKKRENI